VPITQEEFDKIITGKNEPLLAIVLNQETESKPQKEPETNTIQQIDTVTLISNSEVGINGYEQKKGLVVVVRKLAPNEPHQCFNAPCVLEAVYKVKDPYRGEPYFFCEADWIKTKRYYEDNGCKIEFSEETS
jgi:hypothetical protein